MAAAQRILRDPNLSKLATQKFHQNITSNADATRHGGAAASGSQKQEYCSDHKNFKVEMVDNPDTAKTHERVQIDLDANIPSEESTNKNMFKKVNFS